MIDGFDAARGDILTSDNTFDSSDTLTADIQVTLKIVINGQTAEIPADAGAVTTPDSVAQVISENADGSDVVAFRSTDPTPPTFTLGKFFNQWGTTLSGRSIAQFLATNGGSISMTVTHSNGTQTVPTSDFKKYQVQNGDSIVITYSS